jgi:hypothetical protein
MSTDRWSKVLTVGGPGLDFIGASFLAFRVVIRMRDLPAKFAARFRSKDDGPLMQTRAGVRHSE